MDNEQSPGRREFLQTGVAVAAALPLAAAVGTGSAPQLASPPLSFHRVIADDRFAASVAWATAMATKSQPLATTAKGDVTPIWYDDLYHQWKQAPSPIAGLTAHGPLFCLEQLAAGHGMRVVACRLVRGEVEALAAIEWMLDSPERWASMPREVTPDDDALYAWIIAPKALAGGRS